jgi:hypothetical protein
MNRCGFGIPGGCGAVVSRLSAALASAWASSTACARVITAPVSGAAWNSNST